MWPIRRSEPAVWQGCPACGSLNGYRGAGQTRVECCVNGKPVERGTCMRCLDCGETFYALKSGETKLTMRGQPRPVTAATPDTPAQPMTVVQGGRAEPESKYPRGMEGLKLAPPEPEQ